MTALAEETRWCFAHHAPAMKYDAYGYCAESRVRPDCDIDDAYVQRKWGPSDPNYRAFSFNPDPQRPTEPVK